METNKERIKELCDNLGKEVPEIEELGKKCMEKLNNKLTVKMNLNKGKYHVELNTSGLKEIEESSDIKKALKRAVDKLSSRVDKVIESLINNN